METKKKSLNMASLKNLPTTEKRCNKCGFVTFCLRVLYSHRYKCEGKLLGSLICCYCKRKFNYLSLFKTHRKTCVKFHHNKKLLYKPKFKNLIAKKCRKSNEERDPSKLSIISCADCLKIFSSKQDYDVHVKKGFCELKNLVKKQTFSARKSFSKVQPEIEECLSDVDAFPLNDSLPFSMSVKKKRFVSELPVSGVSCKWCKNIYPTKEILQKHLKKNYQCALQQNSFTPYKETYKARKSFGSKEPVVARKSFSHMTPRIILPSFSYTPSGGSARKSLSNSKKRFLKNLRSPSMSTMTVLNQCPICYVSFSDSFEFFQHQKRLNHWGKATKSINSFCKCPFCEKQFFHIRARNAHLRNHADKSVEEIESFLKSSTCNICSKIFVSETAKYQHMKLEHSKSLFDIDSKENRNNKQSLLPLVIKQKLKEYPNTCPICSKNFPSTFSRDKHFKKKHLDSELECKFCPQRYNSVEDLEYHMQKAHYNSFKFECLACKINLATAPHVVLHVTKLHADQDPKKIIRSRDNDSALFDEQGFSSYMPRNNRNKQAEFYCDICKVSFQRLCGLQSHRQSKSHRDTVVKNLDSMHKSLSDLPPSPPPVPKKKVKHPEILTCSECLEEFTTVKDFVPHRLSHFGVHGKYLKINEENLYTCEICGEVSNSHSKVQLHLFWHLQVESTSTEKNPVTVKGKNDPIVPDRLSGQHVAKKSFAKQNSESQQEVVIGGVKKPLFTCENCNIGFTTQAHYSLHVRKFCRKKNVSLMDNVKENDENSMHLPGISTLKKHTINIKQNNLEFCNVCNCLFSSSVKETHKSFCEKCAVDTSENIKDLDHITSNMDLDNVIAVCVLCVLPFDDPQAFANHMLACHKSAINSVSLQKTSNGSTVHCTACNSLFFCPDAMEDHSSFCSNPSCCDFDADSVTDILKAASKLENLIAACISCSLAFDNIQNFNEHMLSHQEPNSNSDLQSSLNELQVSSSDGIIESASVDVNNVLSFGDLEQVSAQIENSNTNDNNPSEILDSSSSQLPDEVVWTITNSSGANLSSDFEEDGMIEPIDKLRNDFSQLFCILINDSELMQQLGFGEQPVDDVLAKVLQQMGQNPALKDSQTSDIDCFRKNIQTLLDFCLKDQIMELIGSGKTSTDEIVAEALKIFTAEKTPATVAE
ncbi:zinc finger protein 721-like [Argiope bruennichi]|uniref:Zinc finger protein 59 like protein n=1 Tax=Argiope bruennichi TaxID=94029 RepID=A0A8T0FDH0_ARGBR|nr:zinc finger protein 721-like [Argiope bruennichi]XP_055941414.1 zinc finger protein 721-like [Argiope bruennichi]KAF8788362.1 Zinc finger protein 59 like protein [Argiope bruennichi]